LCTGYAGAATISPPTGIETAWRYNDIRKTSLRNISYERAKSILYISRITKKTDLYHSGCLLCFNTCEQVYFITPCKTVHFTKQVYRFLLQKTIPGISADGISSMTI
jgi:hypothetical protein